MKDKRTEELAILGNVEKKHQRRIEKVAAGISPNKGTKKKELAGRAASAPSRRRNGTQRISAINWNQKKYEGTPEGHFARIMRTKDASPQRRSFVHDPYVAGHFISASFNCVGEIPLSSLLQFSHVNPACVALIASVGIVHASRRLSMEMNSGWFSFLFLLLI